MDCREVNRFLHAYLDGEFDEQERISFAAHLHSCESCQRSAGLEASFRHKIRQHYQPPAAPAWLELKVKRALRQAGPDQAGLAWKSYLWRLRWLAPVTVGLVLLVLGGRAHFSLRTMAQAALVADSVQWHRQDLPMDVTSPSPETVRRFFSDKVPFAVRPPVFKQPQTLLMGGRLSSLKEHRAAYLKYLVGGQRVSVFIFDADDLVPEKIQWHKLKGYNVALYTAGGTGYAVASDMDPRRMIRLISHAR